MWVQRLFSRVFTIVKSLWLSERQNYAAALLKPFYQFGLPHFACRRETATAHGVNTGRNAIGLLAPAPDAELCHAAANAVPLYKLANDGIDTRALQAYLGHRDIQNTTRYTALAPDRFKGFWRD